MGGAWRDDDPRQHLGTASVVRLRKGICPRLSPWRSIAKVRAAQKKAGQRVLESVPSKKRERRVLPLFFFPAGPLILQGLSRGDNYRIRLPRFHGEQELKVNCSHCASFSGNAPYGRSQCAGGGSSGYRTCVCGSARRLASFDCRVPGERPVGDEDRWSQRLRTLVYAGRLCRGASAGSDSGDLGEDARGTWTNRSVTTVALASLIAAAPST